MSMSKCKVCRRAVRKTVNAVVLKKGDLISSRLCRECAADGVLLVAPGDKPLVCACGEGPATCCNRCASKEAVTAVKGLVKAYTSAVGGRAATVADEHVPGKAGDMRKHIKHLEMAINYLENVAALTKDG